MSKDRSPESSGKTPPAAPQPRNVVGGIPDHAPTPQRWRIWLAAVILLAWLAVMVWAALGR
jgi:hypothetical protein